MVTSMNQLTNALRSPSLTREAYWDEDLECGDVSDKVVGPDA